MERMLVQYCRPNTGGEWPQVCLVSGRQEKEEETTLFGGHFVLKGPGSMMINQDTTGFP